MFSGVVVLGVWAPVAALALPEMLPVVFSGGGVVVLELAEPLTPPVLLCAPVGAALEGSSFLSRAMASRGVFRAGSSPRG